MKISKDDKTLIYNTTMLYLMQAMTFIFPLITFPYLTRILGVENYGIYVFANTVMIYFQMFINFGFLLSGTELCSRYRNDREKLLNINSAIVYSKLLLSIVGFIILIALISFLKVFDGKEMFVISLYIPLILTAFIPDYLFRGIEKMGAIAYRTIFAKIIYIVSIFVFVNDSNDYYFISLAMLLSNILIVIWSWIYIVKKLNMTLGKINFKDVKAQIKHSSIFFASRIATTAYGASNVLVLGIYGFSNTALGIYGAADNLITYGKAVFSPIADSLYPYMIKNKKYRLVKYILLLMVPLISAACIVMYFMADFIIELMCGKEYMEAVPIFRLMIPLLIIALPTYLFGYPMLGAINQNNKANSTVIVGAIFHIIGLMILYVGQILTFNNVIYLTITTEVIILILRIYYFNKYKNRGRGLLKEDSR